MTEQDTHSIDPILEALEKVGRFLGIPLYLVGGYLRDLLLARPSADYDVVVLADVMTVSREIARILGGEVLSSSEFETAKVRLETGNVIDIARARKERYERPGALPTVQAAEDLESDLRRRDFTINAMAVPLNPLDVEGLIDPFGGREDLEKGIVRVIREKSFEEDPTRAFRAIRYRNRFEFRYAPGTLRQFDDAREHMMDLSFSRIRNELRRISVEEKRADMFLEIKELGLLRAFQRGYSPDPRLFSDLDRSLGSRFKKHWVLFFSLFGIIPFSNVKFSGLRRDERKVIEEIFSKIELSLPNDLGDLHRVLSSCTDDAIHVLSVLRPNIREQLVNYIDRRKMVKVHLRGYELPALGVLPGRDIGEVLLALFVAKLRGEVGEDEVSFVKEWVKRRESH